MLVKHITHSHFILVVLGVCVVVNVECCCGSFGPCRSECRLCTFVALKYYDVERACGCEENDIAFANYIHYYA